MHDYLTRYATKTNYGDDTYWGGKSLTQFGQYMLIAQETNDPAFKTLRVFAADGANRLVHLHAG